MKTTLKKSVLIDIKNISKTYNGEPAVKQLSFKIKRGAITVLHGPQGTGKTTTIDCIASLVEPDDKKSIDRKNITDSMTAIDIRRTIGYVPDEDDTIDYLTGNEYLQLVAAAYKKPKNELLYQAHMYWSLLGTKKLLLNQLIHTYDHSLKKQLQLVAILSVQPPIICIDEPTHGLDPELLDTFVQLITKSEFKNSGILIGTDSNTLVDKLLDYAVLEGKSDYINIMELK